MTERENQKLLALVPPDLIHMSFGYVFGKWNCWAQIKGYWYRGTHPDITEAYTIMLQNAAENKSVTKVITPLDGRTKEAKKLKEETSTEELKDFF